MYYKEGLLQVMAAGVFRSAAFQGCWFISRAALLGAFGERAGGAGLLVIGRRMDGADWLWYPREVPTHQVPTSYHSTGAVSEQQTAAHVSAHM
jgi:hypothetical protein